MPPTHEFSYQIVVFSVAIIISLLLGIFTGYHLFHNRLPLESERLNSSDYKFINPLLDQINEEVAPLLNDEVSAIKKELTDIIDNAIENKQVNNASVYYRDLNDGPWFQTGEQYNYQAASLFKVPLMIAFLKIAETEPALLQKKVTYEKAFENVPYQNIAGSNVSIELGKNYTILELIEYMIIYSDNYAAYLLLEHIDPQHVAEVFHDLDVPIGNGEISIRKFGPRTYSSFYRILYNGTYLSNTYSEQALEILSRSAFKHGVRAVLKPSVVASTKFGIANDDNNPTEKQLHECGIIYWKVRSPTILCIMTHGSDFDAMTLLIQEITLAVQTAVLKEDRTSL